MNKQHLFLIFLMSLLTLLPRWLPLLFSKFAMPTFLQKWVKGIPYAALSALLFPSIFFVDKNDVTVGIIGLAASIALALLKVPAYIVVVGAIAVIYGYYSW